VIGLVNRPPKGNATSVVNLATSWLMRSVGRDCSKLHIALICDNRHPFMVQPIRSIASVYVDGSSIRWQGTKAA
jgi:hypothetical protein